ncbi:MAG TPA: hypothetical protein VEY67_01240 [Candidatus Dormibacteraeota bacterium]|nr:hypothetical protein [Candidatus Dormibacteraeota bacterium]
MSRTRLTGTFRAACLIVVASVIIGLGLFLATTAYAEFGGVKATTNARAWASRPLRYAPSACQACHQAETAKQATNRHGAIDCETCHGLVGSHPGADRAAVKPLPKPTGALCVQCHAAVVGRPAALAQIDPATHYNGGTGTACLRCHDPHAVVAVAPPRIVHPTAGLPACTTCHNPNGLKRIPTGHELVADTVCLTCHRPLGTQP